LIGSKNFNITLYLTKIIVHDSVLLSRQGFVFANSLLQLLLWSEVVAVSTLLLPAVDGPGVEPGVAHAADHLVAVVLLGQDPQAGLDHSSSQSQHQVEGGLLLDVVIRKGSTILELLASKDQSLLVWRNTLLVLDLGLDILNVVTWLNLKCDGLSSEGLHKNLHVQLYCRSESNYYCSVI